MTMYPKAPRSDHADDYHGHLISDPFRPLEDVGSDATKSWLEQQRQLTISYFDHSAHREAVKKRIVELIDRERLGVPFHRGRYYFYFRNDGLQNQSVLWIADSPDAEPEVLLDPNTFAEDGSVALSRMRLSKDCRYLAYGRNVGGSDWDTWRVLDVETRTHLDDELKGIRFPIASWTHDHEGFYYCGFGEDAETRTDDGTAVAKNRVYFHKIGTPQSEDPVVFELDDGDGKDFVAKVSEDGTYLLIFVYRGADDDNEIYYAPLTTKTPQFEPMIQGFPGNYVLIGSQAGTFWFRTNDSAPNGRLVEVDASDPSSITTRTIVQEHDHDVIQRVSIIDHHILITYLRDAHTVVRVFALDGTYLHDADLPGIGTVTGFEGLRDHEETYYSYQSYSVPHTIFTYNVRRNESRAFREQWLRFDPFAFETKQVFVPSADGTKIPMFLTHRKDLAINGNTPTYLYGYGGFGFSHTPLFSAANVIWMEQGGIYAVANVRGGGEYGRTWHHAAIRERKQTSFNDFITCAEWLQSEGYTNPQKLAIGGRSNGGLLVGAAITQHPKLFKAAIAGVGLFDMLRYHEFTIGWAWKEEFGCSEDAEQFEWLKAYSPLHNVKTGTKYPSVMISTGQNDNRVFPAHSFKFAATLQEAQASEAPILLRLDANSGHGAGKPTNKFITEISDILAFLFQELGN